MSKETFTLAIEPDAPVSTAEQPDSFSLVPIEQIEMEIKARIGIIGENAVVIGNMLFSVKKRLKDSQDPEDRKFTKWVEEKCEFSQSLANTFMRIAREIPKTPALAKYPYTKYLPLLSLPVEEREPFAEEINLGDRSQREIKRLIKEKEDAEKARIAAEKLAEETAAQLEAQKQLSARQQDLAEQYAEKYYGENERANTLETQLQTANNTIPDPVEIEVPPADYEQIKAKAEQEKRRADEAEEYAVEQEAERQRLASELRKLKETRADMPLQGNSPLSLDSFSSTIKQFVAQVGMAPNMAPFFRAMGPDVLRAYSQWVDVLAEWVSGTKEAIGEGTQFVDAHESAVV